MASSKWMTIEQAMTDLDVGREQLNHLRKLGVLKMRKTSKKGQHRLKFTHCLIEDVNAYKTKRDSSPEMLRRSKMGRATRGHAVVLPVKVPATPQLIKFGDAWRLPEGTKLMIVDDLSGPKLVDSSHVMVI